MTILRLSELLYGEQIRSSVFEPLLADRHQELAAHRSIALGLRWWFAIASAFVTCAPRATFGHLPSSLLLDLGKRAVIFGALAYALLLGLTTMSRGKVDFPPSLANTVPFLVIPVIWRIWVASIPRHQKRLLAAACAALCMVLCAVDADNWLLSVGYATSVAWLAAWGWRLGDPNFPGKNLTFSGTYQTFSGKYQTSGYDWYRTAMVASALMVAWWPIGLAMQIGLLPPFLRRHYLLTSFILAGAIALNIENVPRERSRREQ